MCAWWVYKCNNAEREYQVAWGDWEEVFSQEGPQPWGRAELVPDFRRLRAGDQVLAYQTDRNELVGIARVDSLRPDADGAQLWLVLVERIGVKIRPLRKGDSRTAAIPAFQPGPIRTVYEISDRDAAHLLAQARGVLPRSERRFMEGERRAATTSSRNAALREAAKERWGLDCYCCGFNYESFYGPIGDRVAIVHHLSTFDEVEGPRAATVEDVRVVCANCHQIIHLWTPPMDVDELKALVAERSAQAGAGPQPAAERAPHSRRAGRAARSTAA